MPSISAVSRRAAGAAALLAALSACSWFHSYFPSREEVFKPVPTNLGEERVVGGDTAYVLTGRGYRVTTRDRELLADVKTPLDRTAAAFRRFLAVDPPTVDVRLEVVGRDRRRRGEAQRADTARRSPPPADTGRVVTMVAWRAGDRRAGGPGGGAMGGASVPTGQLVRAWLSAMTDSLTRTTASRAAAPATDSARRAAAVSDPRIPDWLERAIPALVAGVPEPDLAAAQLARQKDKLIPLRTLFTSSHPEPDRAGPGDARGGPREQQRGDRRGGPPGRGGGGYEVGPGARRGGGGRPVALEGGALFDAEAVTVAAYLAQRESPTFVGDVFRLLVNGGSVEGALQNAHAVAHDLDAFERGWRGWLDEQSARVDEARRGR